MGGGRLRLDRPKRCRRRSSQGASCPAIVADFYEDESSSCTSDCNGTAGIPGHIDLEESLGTGPTWSVSVSLVHTDDRQPPGIDIYAYCDENQNGHVDEGETCIASTSISGGDHSGVTFDRSTCPGRL